METRHTLYPKLDDHESVKGRPDVQGMCRNVYFLDHHHRESGGEDDAMSRHNQFEVWLLCDKTFLEALTLPLG